MRQVTDLRDNGAGAATAVAPHLTARRRGFEWSFLVLAVPALVVYVGFLVAPVLSGFYFSLTRWDGINPPEWAGIGNFIRLAGDLQFASALLHTFAFAGVILVGHLGAGLGLALLLNRSTRLAPLLRGVFFIPALLSSAVISLLWGFIYNPLVGVLAQVTENLGMTKSALGDVLGSQNTAIWGVSAAVIWQYAGYMMVIFLAGLKSIPEDVYEAAALDGAGGWRRFRSITLPLLVPTISIAATISLAGNLRLFDHVYVMTGGGPGGATETVGTLIYKTTFASSNYGYSVAQSVVLTFVITIVVLVQRWVAARTWKG